MVAELGRTQWGNWVVTREGVYYVGKGLDGGTRL